MRNGSETKEAWVRGAVQRYQQPLLRYAYRFTKDKERARDVVQDTFMKLCTAVPDAVDDHLAGWLYTVCRNRALDVRAKETRMDAAPANYLENLPENGPPPSATAMRNETHAIVLAVVDTMPKKHQEAFRLKFQDGLSYREIGQVLGVSIGTVSNLITATLDAVRDRLVTETTLAQEVQSHGA